MSFEELVSVYDTPVPPRSCSAPAVIFCDWVTAPKAFSVKLLLAAPAAVPTVTPS